jgi:hypothetical protein
MYSVKINGIEYSASSIDDFKNLLKLLTDKQLIKQSVQPSSEFLKQEADGTYWDSKTGNIYNDKGQLVAHDAVWRGYAPADEAIVDVINQVRLREKEPTKNS